MQALRTILLQRAWRRLAGHAPRRPSAPQRWDADAQVLVLYSQDDPEIVQHVRRLSLRDLGLADDPSAGDARGGARNSGARNSGAGTRPLSTLAFTAVPRAATELSHDLWTPQQLTYGGVAKAEAMEPVLAKAYDLVLNLLPEPFPPFDYLAAQVCAHLRIVGHDGAPQAYDIMIGAGDGPEAFVRAVAGYLRAQNPYAHA